MLRGSKGEVRWAAAAVPARAVVVAGWTTSAAGEALAGSGGGKGCWDLWVLRQAIEQL